MLTLDISDIVLTLLVIVLSLTAMTFLVLSIFSIFYPIKAKNVSAKYQNYGYTIMSVNIFVLEMTYLVPYCAPSFTTNLNLCIAFGATQHFVENFSTFFIIGMSVCLLLYVFSSSEKCKW